MNVSNTNPISKIEGAHPRCLLLGTHCAAPPDPPVESGLEVIWNGSLIEFDTKISYACKNGMKIEDDFKILQVEATCRSGNTWEEPLWLNCVDSKFHCIGKYHGSQTVMLFSHYSQIMSCPATSPRGWFCHGEGRGHTLWHKLLN